MVGDRRLDLRAREFDLLAALARDPGVVLTPRRAARGRLGHGLPRRDAHRRRPRGRGPQEARRRRPPGGDRPRHRLPARAPAARVGRPPTAPPARRAIRPADVPAQPDQADLPRLRRCSASPCWSPWAPRCSSSCATLHQDEIKQSLGHEVVVVEASLLANRCTGEGGFEQRIRNLTTSIVDDGGFVLVQGPRGVVGIVAGNPSSTTMPSPPADDREERHRHVQDVRRQAVRLRRAECQRDRRLQVRLRRAGHARPNRRSTISPRPA